MNTKPTLGQSAINTALRECREATDNDWGFDNRPIRALLKRAIVPSLVVPRDEIWLRRADDALERIKVRPE